jgi:hypothetical protein
MHRTDAAARDARMALPLAGCPLFINVVDPAPPAAQDAPH